MQDKRGLSAIVATLIIILLVLVAAGIIWVVIKNIITEGAEEIELGRFTLDLSIKSAYIEGTNVKVLVRRSPGGGDLVGVKFIFYDGMNSFSVDKKISLGELDERTFTFSSTEVGGIDKVQTVSVAPIYKSSSGRETVGEITDTATISGSGNGNGGNGNGDNGGTGDPGTGDCGDGTIQSPNGDGINEVCDGSNLNSQTCESLGLGTGTLSCDFGCQFDTSQCSEGTPLSCDGTWNQTDIDDGNECDGIPLPTNCLSDCTCSAGFTADEAGGCTLNPPVNSGTIYSVWPIEAVKYFDSVDLPIDVSMYTIYYVNFSNSEEDGCFRITWAEYMETNGRSYIRTEFMVNISTDEEGYDVWEAENCGA